jgi:hypothetical protein
MHRAAEAAIEPGFPREDFAVRAIAEKAPCQLLNRTGEAFLNRAQKRAVRVGAHDLEQVVVAQLSNGGKALGENLAVAAVRAEDVVVGRERKRHPDRRRFLPDREMGRPGMGVGDPLVRAFRLDLLQRRLELANAAHVLPDVQQIGSGEARRLLRDRFVVRVQWNVSETNGLFDKDLLRLYDN